MNRKGLYEIFQNQLGVDPKHIKDSTNLREDLGADSLDEVELVCCLEEETDIVIQDSEIGGIVTVVDVINLLKRKNVWEE